MSSAIPDFTDDETACIQAHVFKRWGLGKVELIAADVEVQLNPDDATPTECPAIFWQADGCGFVVHKVAAGRYRCNFFYEDMNQYGTGIPEYDDLDACTLTLLKMQADEHSVRTGQLCHGKQTRDYDGRGIAVFPQSSTAWQLPREFASSTL
jgi:hypothetical protein